MVIESIREFNRAVPFAPYEVRMNGGGAAPLVHNAGGVRHHA
jgi:hypothetical protein